MSAPMLKQKPALDGDESELRREVERLIEKGRCKDAFKQAKLCLHRQNSPENRRLVERTYLLRIEELVRGGILSSAAEVARHFLEFGVTDPQTLECLVLILPHVGMSNQALALSGRLESPQAKASLSLKVADEAVLHPAQSSASPSGLLGDAERIRAALAALEQSNDAEGLALLKDIPRSSPWADWRYFVRGLAAFYRHDHPQATENWGRLDPQRAAHYIATALQRTVPGAMPGGPVKQPPVPHKRGELSRLEIALFGEPLLTRLEDLQQHLGQNGSRTVDWQKACQTLGPLRLGLRRLDPRLSQRLTEILIDPLISAAISRSLEQARRLVREFTNAAEPLPLDPSWHRLWAILWEKPQGDLSAAIDHWRKYLTDLEQLVALNPHERRRLQAVVWRHIAELLSDQASPDPRDFFGSGNDLIPLSRQLAPAFDALEQSLRCDPAQRATYELLMELHQDCNQPEAEAEVARRCLASFPQDLEALRLLIEHHRRRDEPEKMLPYVEQARKIQPLETKLAWDEHWTRSARARHLALSGRFDEARGELARADEVLPDLAQGYRMLARRAALEYKAGQTERAEGYVRDAHQQLGEPTALWLALSIESERYQLPPRWRRHFQDSWRVALGKKASSETAGQVAEILLGYQMSGVKYIGLAQHLADVAAYLGRTTRTKYRETDLRDACSFLQQLGSHEDLLAKLVKKGLKSFPKSSVFHCLASEQEINKGPYAASLSKARKHVETALRLTEGSTDPQDLALSAELKRRLLTFDDLAGAMKSMPFGGRGRGPGANLDLDIRDIIQRMMGGENGEEDFEENSSFDDETDFFFGSPRDRLPRAPRKRK
jgi:tetratricopeptide (TPR) repeat protein